MQLLELCAGIEGHGEGVGGGFSQDGGALDHPTGLLLGRRQDWTLLDVHDLRIQATVNISINDNEGMVQVRPAWYSSCLPSLLRLTRNGSSSLPYRSRTRPSSSPPCLPSRIPNPLRFCTSTSLPLPLPLSTVVQLDPSGGTAVRARFAVRAVSPAFLSLPSTFLPGSNRRSQSPVGLESIPTTVREWPSCCR